MAWSTVWSGGRATAVGVVVFALVVSAGAAAGQSPLADAAMNGDLRAVRALLADAADADVNAAQGDGMTALHWAAFHDDLDMATMLLEAKPNVRVKTRIGAITPLNLAGKNGSATMIGALVAAGADVNYPATTGATPLMMAAMSGRVDAVRHLIQHGAYANARDFTNGQTPLMFAAWENRAAVITELAAHGAHVGLTSNVLSLVDTTLDEQGHPVAPRRRRAPGGNSAMGGMTALHFAARDGHLDAVAALVDAGADVNQVSGGDGSTPIVFATGSGHYTLAKYLLDAGADPNITNLDGLGPLHATVHMRYAPVSWAPNPLTDQEVVGSLDLIQALLDRGADPNARLARKLWFSPSSHDRSWTNHAGGTPFWRAAMSSDVGAMRLLVEAGADPKIATVDGTTPLMVAAGIGWTGNFSQNAPDSFLAAVQYCIELGIDVNATDAEGMTALHGAASRGDSEMVRYLMEQGARLDVINTDGDSAADMAFGPSRFFIPKPETAYLLRDLGAPFQDNCRSDQCVDGKFNGGIVP